MTQVRLMKSVVNTKDISAVIREFLIFCEAQGLSEDSLRSHKYALRKFFRTYQGELSDSKNIKASLSIMLQGVQDAYYNKQLNAIRKFFDYCKDEGITDSNPATAFKYRRPTVQIVDHSEEVVKSFLKVIDKTTFAGLRDYIFAILILDNGIRPNEALQLKVEDVNFAAKQIRVRREYSKTRIERYLPVSLPVLQEMKKLIAVRPTTWKTDAPILCTFDGHKTPARNMQKRFRDYSLMIRETITPYHLRHLFGLWFIRNGGDAFSLQKIMGHTKMNMTSVYVNLADADIKKSHEKASPLTNLMSPKRVRSLTSK